MPKLPVSKTQIMWPGGWGSVDRRFPLNAHIIRDTKHNLWKVISCETPCRPLGERAEGLLQGKEGRGKKKDKDGRANKIHALFLLFSSVHYLSPSLQLWSRSDCPPLVPGSPWWRPTLQLRSQSKSLMRSTRPWRLTLKALGYSHTHARTHTQWKRESEWETIRKEGCMSRDATNWTFMHRRKQAHAHQADILLTVNVWTYKHNGRWMQGLANRRIQHADWNSMTNITVDQQSLQKELVQNVIH